MKLRIILAIVLLFSLVIHVTPATVLAVDQEVHASKVTGTLTVSPRNSIDVGRTVTVKAVFPNKGKVNEGPHIQISSKENAWEAEDVNISLSKNNYIVTGSFTAEEEGAFSVSVSMTMEDSAGNLIKASASKKLSAEGGWIYYFAKGSFYKDKLTGREPIQVAQVRKMPLSIHYGKDAIVYLELIKSNKIGGILRYSLHYLPYESSIPRTVSVAGNGITSMGVDDDVIYYAEVGKTGERLYKLTKDRMDKELVMEHVDYVQVSDGWLYYHSSEDQGLYRMKTDGSHKERLIDKDTTIFLNRGYYYVYKDAIEYMDSDFNRILMEKDGSNKKSIKSSPGYIVGAKDEFLYYIDNEALYRKDMETDEVEMLVSLKKDSFVQINETEKYALLKRPDNNLYKVEWK